MLKEKSCFSCKEVKSAEEFYKQKDTKSGLSTYCKECDRKKKKALYPKKREYYEKNREKYNEIARKAYYKKRGITDIPPRKEKKDLGDYDKSTHKRCNRCTVQPIENFYKMKASPDGIHYTCIACLKKYTKERREANKKPKVDTQVVETPKLQTVTKIEPIVLPEKNVALTPENPNRKNPEATMLQANRIFKEFYKHLINDEGVLDVDLLKLELRKAYYVLKRHENLSRAVTGGRIDVGGVFTRQVLEEVEEARKETIRLQIENMKKGLNGANPTYKDLETYFELNE